MSKGPRQGIFLDFYGTVAAGDRRAVESICQQILDDYAMEGSCAELAHRWGMRYFAAIEREEAHRFRLLREIERDTLIETCGESVAGFQADKYIGRLNDYLACPPLFPEVKTVLGQLELPVCIVSNADECELRAAIAVHELQIELVVSSESARSYKPHPAIFRHALKLTGWSPERVLHVGDSVHSDIGGAKPLGIPCAWVQRDERISDLGSAAPDYTWTDLWPLLLL